MKLLSILLLAASLLLGGCHTVPPANGVFPTQASDMAHWQIKGRIGFSNGEDGGSAHILWRHISLKKGIIDLSGPLYFGGVRITYDEDHATLDTGDEKVTAASPTLLAWRVTGMLLPVEALDWWVRGLPWPKADVKKKSVNTAGQILTLEQAGWQLEFDRYQQQGPLMLPGRIKARHGKSRFTLLISQWGAL